MRNILLICIFSVLAIQGYSQTRIDGSNGKYSRSTRYTANTFQLALYGVTSFAFPKRVGGGAGLNFWSRNGNITSFNLTFYYNSTNVSIIEHNSDCSAAYYWTAFGRRSSFRALFGLGADVGVSAQHNLLFNKRETRITYGPHVGLELDYLVDDFFGLFLSCKEELRCLERITDVRFRYFINAGVKIGL